MMASGALQRFQLEIGERNRMHVIVSVVAFLLAVGLLGHAVLQSDGIDTQSTEAFETRSVVNAKGGYELEAPARWRVKKRGRATTMFSSRGDILVTVGPAPRGNLADSANEIFDSIAKTYSKVAFTGATNQTVDEREAVVFGGKGTNERGVRLRFVGVTFDDGGRNHSMTAFVAENSDSGRVIPRIERILNTFTATTK